MRDPDQRRTGRRTLALGALLTAAVMAGACGGESRAEDAPDSRSTARDLLQSRPTDGSGAMSTVPDAQPGRAPGQERQIDVAVLGFNLGPDEAPLRVVEMSDYGCGYCRQFHQQTWPTLREEFVQEGKVQWKFLPFVTGMFENSPVATEAAECTLEQGMDVFVPMHERLWDDQSTWKNSAEPHAVVRAFADDAGADMGTWDSCMAEDRRTERVMAGTALARQLGVRGTPTFFVVGYPPLQGALPLETFKMVLDAAHDDAVARMGG